ncbi:MAG: hypothetical protein ACKOW3_09285 [Hyphomicrobium sp.]
MPDGQCCDDNTKPTLPMVGFLFLLNPKSSVSSSAVARLASRRCANC